MARRSIVNEDEETRVDLSPMIDCIFILLIFFIVATVFVEEKGLQASKPDSSAAVSEHEIETLVLRIDADNKVYVQEKEVRVGELAGRVQSSLDSPETPVVIRAHESSDHGVFVSVWDAARRGGAEMLSFSTIN
jgi:biopolymer transport protein ExbD